MKIPPGSGKAMTMLGEFMMKHGKEIIHAGVVIIQSIAVWLSQRKLEPIPDTATNQSLQEEVETLRSRLAEATQLLESSKQQIEQTNRLLSTSLTGLQIYRFLSLTLGILVVISLIAIGWLWGQTS